ncbi:MAG: hypothetical protein P4L77_12165 [Sulfuriferula sp.]|nr:hypothetical protein [Sulfuriferula sp.]
MTNSESLEFCAALRAVAAFFEQHPTLPTPDIPFFYKYNVEAETLREVALIPGLHREKEYSGDSFYLRTEIPWSVGETVGTVRLTFHGDRVKVCKRKVTGTRIVPEQYIPGYTRPASTEEVVEWECEPLLAPSHVEETVETTSE